jgi:Zn-dependent peptidase ImmA (M78 family)
MIIDIVNAVKEKYNIRDIDSVAASENIDLISIELPESIKGMYYSQEGFTIIALNNRLSANDKIETFWHEYYHYLISVGNYISAKLCLDSIKTISNKDENKAEEFVARIMIENIEDEDDRHTLSEKWNVSEKLAILRLSIEKKSLSKLID